MLISEWMTKEVITVEPEMSMMRASKLLKDRNIRRLPVVDADNRIVGIVTDRDIKEASPSKATTLDVHEIYYLLSEIKVKDIMTPNPVTIGPEDTVEKAAVIMLERRVEGLPVVDEKNHVVGIVTESDIFKVLISITGVFMGGAQLGFRLSLEPGSLKQILDVLKRHGARISSILTAYHQEEGFRQVYIRIQDMEKSAENTLRDELKTKHNLLFWVRDNVRPTALS
jgi:acetoin utilization protein AcuB